VLVQAVGRSLPHRLVIDRLFTCGVHCCSLLGAVSATLLFLATLFLILLRDLVLVLMLGSGLLLES
jgi:hypothetical protein